MDDGRLEGQEDKLYVIISYGEDMQIFICNRDVFLLRLSQKYGVPMKNIGFFDVEAPIPAPLIDVKDIRDGMILEMVDKLKFLATSTMEETSNVPYEKVTELSYLETNIPVALSPQKANIPGFLSPKKGSNIPGALPAQKANIPGALSPKEESNIPEVLTAEEETNILLTAVSSPEEEVEALMPSTSSTNEGPPCFKKVKISFKSSKDAGSNLTRIKVQKILFV